MEWIIVIVAVVGFAAYKFYKAFTQDSKDLKDTTLANKFEFMVTSINKSAFKGLGEIKVFDDREFNLIKEGSDHRVNFRYGTGHLIIDWKFKNSKKEIDHRKQFSNARNLGAVEQKELVEGFIREMNAKLKKK